MRLSLFFACTVAALQASVSTPMEPFTAKEISQRHSDRFVLAKPRADRRAALQTAGAGEAVRVRAEFPRLGGIQLIEVPADETVGQTIARLQATGRYEFVERDALEQPDATPNDPSFPSQWALNNTVQGAGYVAGADIEAVAAWDIIREAPNVVVAIVDNGINLTHRDLAANLWRNPSPTFGDVNGAAFLRGVRSGVVADQTGHGSHVAGIIGAAGNNGFNIAGVAWKVQLMALKNSDASGASATSDSAACIDYALAHGAHVINCSFGGTTHSQTLLAALKAARDAGVIVVASAGNDGTNIDTEPHYPANYLLDNIVTVGNSLPNDAASSTSGYGGLVDLFAPGSSILSLDLTATGQVSRSGTSMAAPHVTGALALLRAMYPTETYRQLINRLLRGTDRLAGLNGRAHSGGRLNLLRALTGSSTRPFNDDFSARASIASGGGVFRSNNAGATAETGEAAHAGTAATTTLWWRWTALVNGTVTLSTEGSDYDTVAAVYTGDTLASLTLVAANDNAGRATTSQVSFFARGGVTYQIAVGGKAGAAGLTVLDLGAAPVNDDFAGATALPGNVSVQASGTLVHATLEAGEPDVLGHRPHSSVWYRWTAPRSGRVQASAFSFDFDTVLAVFTGSAVGGLAQVAAGDDTGVENNNTDSLCTFQAIAGTTYSFKVDTKRPTETGDFVFTLTDSRWQFSTEGALSGSPALAPDGTIYFGGGTPDRRLYALAPDGSLKWRYESNGTLDNCSPAVGLDGTIYFGNTAGTVTALRPDGTVRWTRSVSPRSISVSPALGIDGTIYLHASDGYLYALNPASGDTRWRTQVEALTFASPVVGPDGTIYQGSSDGHLYALRPDGTVKWRFDTDSDTFATPAIDAAGHIYFTTYSTSTLYSLTPDGRLRWAFEGASTAYTSTSPSLDAKGSLVYFGASNRILYAIDTADGSRRWQVTLGNAMYASTPAVGADGSVYIGCYDGRVYAISAAGTVQRTWDTGQPIRSSPTIANRTLFIGSGDAKLYALDVETDAATGAWTQYRQNARRTGRLNAGELALTLSPSGTNVVASQQLGLSVVATGTDPFAFQWSKDGVAIPGATQATYLVPNASAADAGTYTAVVTNAQGRLTTRPAVVTIESLIPSRVANFSVRAGPGTGAQALLLAFTVSPGANKPLLLRVAGPTLGALGLPGTLTDPQLTLLAGETILAENDNWGGNAAVAAATTRVSAFPFPADSRDAALVQTLRPGTYTVLANGAGAATGIALGEIYDTDPAVTDAPGQSRLMNLAARGQVGASSNVLIAGFSLLGNVPKRVLIRAVGPSLSQFGLTGALSDPVLDVYTGTTLLGRNDDWSGSAALTTAFGEAGAFAYSGPTSRDSAVILTLTPGIYTARVSGFSAATGIALIELYELP